MASSSFRGTISARSQRLIVCWCLPEQTATRSGRSSRRGLPISRPVDDIYQKVGKGETAYEATFEDLARTQGSNFARADASIHGYVMDPTRLQGADWSAQDVLTPLLLSLLGAAAVYGATHLKTSRRARLEPIPQPA